MIPISSIDLTHRDLIRLACAVVIFAGDDARGYRKPIRAQLPASDRIGVFGLAWRSIGSPDKRSPTFQRPCPRYSADLDRQENPGHTSPPPIARSNSAPWSEPHTDISEFRRCRMIGDNAGSPVSGQASVSHGSPLLRRREPRQLSLPKAAFQSGLKMEVSLPLPAWHRKRW